MLKGVLFQRIFKLLDLALLLTVIAVGLLVISKLFEPAPKIARLEPIAEVTPGAGLWSLGPRDSYNGIIANKLFGDAGDRKKDEPPPVDTTAKDETIEETTLPLRLWGTVAMGEKAPLSHAIIEHKHKKTKDVFFVGKSVFDTIILDEVHPRWVILFNRATNKYERLSLDEDTAPATRPAGMLASAAGPGQTQVQPAANPNEVALNREELAEGLQQLTEDLPVIIGDLNPRTYLDENNQPAGITADNIGTLPMAEKLGLKDNDVLQSVNGVKVNSIEELSRVIDRFQTLKSFRIGILRGGKTEMLTYRLEEE